MRNILAILFTIAFATGAMAQNNVLTDQGESIEITPNSFQVNRTGIPLNNSAIGAQALSKLSTLSSNKDNFAFGYQALRNLNTGNRNVAIGSISALSLSDNSENTAIGIASLALNNGRGNTSIGFLANGYAPNTNYKLSIGAFTAAFDSSSSVVVGANSGIYAASGADRNFFLGANSGQGIRNSRDNIAVGVNAMQYGQGSYDNVAIGYESIQLNGNSVYRNVAVGYQALKLDSTHNDWDQTSRSNVALGFQAMRNDTSSLSSTAIGYRAMASSRKVDNSIAIGHDAFRFLREGIGNVGIGYLVGGLLSVNFGNGTIEFGLAKADNCTLVGYRVGQSLINEGYRHTAMGSKALPSSQSGTQNNVAIGCSSGTGATTGNNNTFLGAMSSSAGGNYFNTTAIGYQAEALSSNAVILGNDQVTTIGGYASFTNFSDKRLKSNIEYENNLGLNFINHLKPARYNYKSQKDSLLKDGFIAQDVEKILLDQNLHFSGHQIMEDDAKTQQLSYELFTIPLINSTQELEIQLSQMENDNWKPLNLSAYHNKLK